MIALNTPLKPDLNKLQSYLKQINDNSWYTNFGPLEKELTQRLSEYLGVNHLLLVNNGTSALQIAAQTMSLENLITTPFTFIATTSAFIWQKKNVEFADICEDSFNLSVGSVAKILEARPYIDGVVATHVYGNPCDVDGFDDIQCSSSVKVIYDAAHAFGVKVRDSSVLKYGDASTLSFHATKLFHTGEGGAICFKDKEDLLKAKLLVNFGFNEGENTGVLGINAKLNEYQAAVGLVNLENINNIIEHRAYLFELYLKELRDVVKIPTWNADANKNGAYMPIFIEEPAKLNKLIQELKTQGVGYRKYFESIDKYYSSSANCYVPNSHKISTGIICLPLHAYMSSEDVLKICKIVRAKS